MAVPPYAVRHAFFYNFPDFKVYCVPFPLYGHATLGTVVGHLSGAGNAFVVIDLMLRWTANPEGDYEADFRALFAARGAWLATMHRAGAK